MVKRSLFFDFGGTLCPSRADILPFFQRAAARAGVEVPWKEYLQANEESWNELWPQAPSLVGKRPAFADRVHELALRKIGFYGPVEKLVSYMREEATSASWYTPFPETEPTLARLRRAGVPLHVISGHVDYLPIIIAKLGWSGLFETVTFTQEVGVQKPDPRVFRFALRRAGVEPAESVYVGDSWDADYVGARNAGMLAVWLNRAGRPLPEPCRQIRTLRDLEGLLSKPDA